MKNNAILFMIDSVVWESVGSNRCEVSPTPFMDSLKNEGLWTTNLYSHGPYTDAATRSLYTGRNTLDDFGYFFKLNASPINHYRAFKENGYETIGFYYPYYMMGKNVTHDIDKLYFKTGFEFGSEWGGIFSYYFDIHKKRELNDDEFLMLSKRMELLFDVWCHFYDELLIHGAFVCNMEDILAKADIKSGKETIYEEKHRFESDRKAYLEDFLEKGLDHRLNNLNDVSIDNRISREYLDYVYSAHKRFFSQLQWNNFKANVFKTMPTPRRILYSIKRYLKYKDLNELEYWKNYFGGLFFFKQVKARWGTKRWQNMPSTQFQLDFVEREILPNRSKEKPFFLCLNIEEAHNNLSFFTYDIQDDKLINDEILMLYDYVRLLGTNFKGNLVYYLGLRYMDYCIEKFCNYLKTQGLWDNTSILFTADHGSSYTFYPVHNQRVNNFYDECYHIPVLIRHPGMTPKEIDSYHYSKDILPTFMDILGLNLSPYFKGTSMIRPSDPHEFILHEYMGPGCPDIIERPVWFSIRDHKYVVAYKVKLFDDFEKGDMCEVYDLTLDPNQFYNIADKVEYSAIQYLLEHIRQRYFELREETSRYYEKLKSSESGVPINFK